MPELSKNTRIASWILQIVVVGVFLMGGPLPKLTGQEPAIALFTELGAEPAGRYAVGLLEGVALILLLVPKTISIGAILAAGLMVGAVFSHLTVLGVSIPERVHPDLAGPMMFVMAVIALLASAGVLVIRRTDIPIIGEKLASGGGSGATATHG